jgi:hypothetical protein
MTVTTPRWPAALLVALCFAVAAPHTGKAQPNPENNPDRKTEEKIAEIERWLEDVTVDVTPFEKKKLTIAQLLEALEQQLPKGKKISFRFDADALGKDLPAISRAPVTFAGAPRHLSVSTVLAVAMSQSHRRERLDYRVGPTHVTITTPERALCIRSYDIRELLQRTDQLFAHLKKLNVHYRVADLRPPGPDDGPALLVRVLLTSTAIGGMAAVPLTADNIRVLNGTRLEIRTNAKGHRDIAHLLADLGGQTDELVLMDACLYEVDRAFFVKHVVPLLRGDESPRERSVAIPITGELFQKLQQQKVVLRGDSVKIWPGRQTTFLCWQRAFCYAGRPGAPDDEPWSSYQADLEGVTFLALPTVGRDRGWMRVQVTRKVTQLVGMAKAKVLNPSTGKDAEVESPNLRKDSATAEVLLQTGQALLLTTDFRPSGEVEKDRVWLALVRPQIWSAARQKVILGDGKYPESDPPKKKPAGKRPGPLPVPVPPTADTNAILQAVVEDVMTSPALKRDRAFYGTPAEKRFALTDGFDFAWPKGFQPAVDGYELYQERGEGPRPFQRRILGIRLDLFAFEKKGAGSIAHVSVLLENVGGVENGSVLGGCFVQYTARRQGKRWVVERGLIMAH